METSRKRPRGWSVRLSVALGFALVAVVLLDGTGSSSAAGQTLRRVVPPLFGAVQVNEPDHDRWAESVAGAGLDSVQVTLYARQQAWHGAELRWDPRSPGVVSEIRAAKRAGLRVVLVMRVALDQGIAANRHLWHGMIWPRPEALQRWYERYRAFVVQGAALAAAEDVDLFAVGNELTSMTSTLPRMRLPDLYAYWLSAERVARVRLDLVQCADQVRRHGDGADLVQLDGGRYAGLADLLRAEEATHRDWTLRALGGDPADLSTLNARRASNERFWRRLIAEARQVYPGPVTYGANFDQIDEVGFWDALDAIGIDAYFPLGRYGDAATARLQRFEEAWTRVARRLVDAHGGVPVVLLELGWTRWAGSTVRPYSYDRVEVLETAGDDRLTCVHWPSQPDDPAEREAAMRALRNTVTAGRFPTLRGFSLWKLTTRAQHRAIEPFAVVLRSADVPALTALDRHDEAYLRLAAEVAAHARAR